MPQSRALIDHAKLENLIAAQLAQATIVAADAGGWGVVVRYGRTEAALAAKRGQPRLFAKLDTAAGYLRGLGLVAFGIDAQAFDPKSGASPRAPRPDRARALRRAHEAAAHDVWFRAQVNVGLADIEAGQVIDERAHDAHWQKRRAALVKRTGAKRTGYAPR